MPRRRPSAITSMSWHMVGVLALAAVARAGSGEPLTFEERVAAQEAIERVHDRHRVWPEANGTPKPSFESSVPREAIERRVERTLAQSLALERTWGRPVTGEQLQRELERIARHTRSPRVLRELLDALGNDPHLAAECLARPVLTDRLVRHFHARDPRWHAAVRDEAQRLAVTLDAASFLVAPGKVHQLHLVVGKPTGGPGSIEPLSRASFDEAAHRFTGEPGRITIEETDEAFVLKLVTRRTGDELVAALRVLPKESSDAWVASAFPDARRERVDAAGTTYFLPPSVEGTFMPESWLVESSAAAPRARTVHLAVWTGSEMIVWGGDDANTGAVATGGRYDPTTDAWTATAVANAAAPCNSVNCTAVWTGSEMIVWGNGSSGRYDPASDRWTTVTALNEPSTRVGHTAVWTGTEMIVWGGQYGTTFQSGGRYRPATDSWSPTSLAGAPAARLQHTAVWTGSEVIVWGGRAFPGNTLATGGRYRPSTDSWTATATSGGPSARFEHTAVWTDEHMVVWGGQTDVTVVNSFTATGSRYDPDLNAWAPTTATNAPAARKLHAAAWTGNAQLGMIVWGGLELDPLLQRMASESGGRYDPTNDVWSTMASAQAPAAREYHSMVWTGSEAIVWGGDGFTVPYFNSGARYNPTTDSWVTTDSSIDPSLRVGHASVWTGSEAILWGGRLPDFAPRNDSYRYDPALDWWRRIEGTPSPELYRTAVWTGSKMLVWGFSGDVFDPATEIVTPMATSGQPTDRSLHSAVWTGTEMIVWGGYDLNGTLQTGGRYTLATDSWSPTSTTGAPAARALHHGFWTGTRMLIFGGIANFVPTVINDGYLYTPGTNSWAPISLTNVPPPRSSAVWTGTQMIVWGDETSTTGGRYTLATDSWSPIGTAGAPPARSGALSAWTGDEWVLWSGADDVASFVTSGGRYRPSSDSWSPMTSTGAPPGRALLGATALWTGESMIVAGGEPDSSLGVYYPNTPPTAAPDILNAGGSQPDTVRLGDGVDLQLTHSLQPIPAWWDDVEGIPAFTATGDWHVVTDQTCSGQDDYVSPRRAWYSGDSATCSYAGGASTSTLTRTASLTVTPRTVLTFSHFLETEHAGLHAYRGPAIPVPDALPAGALSPVAVDVDRQIQDVNVRVNVSHLRVGDLTLSLVAPDATVVVLSALHGGTGGHYRTTRFDDEAATTVAAGSPPWNGAYRPDQPLSALDGGSTLGTWTLRVVDGAVNVSGAIDSWSIAFTTSGADGDAAVVEVNDGSTWRTVAQDASHWLPAPGSTSPRRLADGGGAWRATTIRLADFGIAAVAGIRFSFTEDGVPDSELGWLVDDVGLGEPAGDGNNPRVGVQHGNGSNPAGGLPYHDAWDRPQFEWFLNADNVADNPDPSTPDLDVPEAQLGNYGLATLGDHTLKLRVTDARQLVHETPITLHVTDGVFPAVTVRTPDGGDSWDYSPDPSNRRSHRIVWTASDNIGLQKLRIEYTTNGTTWSCIADSSGSGGCAASGLTAGSTTHDWQMPTASEAASAGQTFPSASARIRVRAEDGSGNATTDASDAPFYVIQPTTSAVQTLVLWNPPRLDAAYAGGSALLGPKLDALAAHNKVNGVVRDLSTVPAVVTAYATWDADPSSTPKANAVAGAIRTYLAAQLQTYTNAAYLVLVGDDAMLPFYRMVDGATIYTEARYTQAPESGLDPSSGVGAALASGHFLTDDYYSDQTPDPTGLAAPHDLLYLNDLATGRLVETPAQMAGVIDAYLAQDGQVNVTSAADKVLVTGFDFIYDAAVEVRGQVGPPDVGYVGAGKPTDCLLDDPDRALSIPCDDQAYSPADLQAQLFGQPSPHRIANVNTHANHFSWATSTGALSTTAMDAQPSILGTVLYTSGCHSGLPVPATDPNPLDLPETMAKKGVVAYVGNTGYGWGLAPGKGLTERLMVLATEAITSGDSIAMGDALAQAKSAYVHENRRYDVFDEKVIHQLTLFGIPNYLVVMDVPSLEAEQVQELPSAADPRARGCAEGICVEKELVSSSGLQGPPPGVTQLDLNFSFGGATYQAVPTIAGTYYALNGKSSGEVGDSIQPHFVYDSTLSGTVSHGTTFLGGSYQQLPLANPVVATPKATTFTSFTEGTLPNRVLGLPTMLRTNNPVAGPDVETTLAVHTGVYEEVPQKQDLFDAMQFSVYYSNSADVTAPAIPDPGAAGFHQLTGLEASFSVSPTDASGIYRCIVTYHEEGGTSWRSLDLAQSGSTWVGTLELTTSLQYFVQAVDSAGNVGVLSVSGADVNGLGAAYGSSWSGPKSFTIALADCDADGMPDAYESQHGSCLFTCTPDAGIDPDRDHLTSLAELGAGTDPCRGDTDGGGDNDGSETANGRDPFDAGDDLHLTITVAKVGANYQISWPDALGSNALIDGDYFVYRSSTPFFDPTDRIGPLPLPGCPASCPTDYTDVAPPCDPCYYNVWNVEVTTQPPTVLAVVPGAGPLAGGTPVFVFGTGFTPGAAVRFCGTPATNVVVVGPNLITCTTPSHAGPPPVLCNVRVTNPNGQDGELVGGFTYQ